MTMCSLFVGNLTHFNMYGGDWNGNLPSPVTDRFPPICGNHYHGALEDWAAREGVTLTKVDFDAFVAPVTKDQILGFLHYCYDSDPSYTDPERMLRQDGRPYQVDKLNAVREQVMRLNPQWDYGLVSECW